MRLKLNYFIIFFINTVFYENYNHLKFVKCININHYLNDSRINQPYLLERKHRDLSALSSTLYTSDTDEIQIPETLHNLLNSNLNLHEQSNIYDENDHDGVNQCVPIHEPICQGLQYTHTWLPNSVGLTTQEESAKRMNDYRSLINVGCSHYLKFFLCTIYFPMCTSMLNPPKILQPCENLCRYVQSKCEPIMKSFSFPWPIELNCNQLPTDQTNMCIKPQNYNFDLNDQQILNNNHNNNNNNNNLNTNTNNNSTQNSALNHLLPNLNHLLNNLNFTKNKNNLQIDKNTILNNPNSNKYNHLLKNKLIQTNCTIVEIPLYVEQFNEKNYTCVKRCNTNLYYKLIEKQFASIWILVWALLCLISCILTIFTYILDCKRFVYPERPIIYIAMCYCCYSIGFILRIIIGYEKIACRNRVDNLITSSIGLSTSLIESSNLLKQDNNLDSMNSNDNLQINNFLIRSGHEGTWCTIIFLILYYFSHASYLWWVMLTITWFLSASCKWGCEGIETISSVLHMFAWALPALKTIIILIMHQIDADELTGLCFVGYQDANSLLIFVLIPQLGYLLIGILFLVIGFYSLISVRSNLKIYAKYMTPNTRRTPTTISNNNNTTTSSSNNNNNTMTNYHNYSQYGFNTVTNPLMTFNNNSNHNIRRLDKLMVKICIFSILYIIPTICVIGVNCYNYFNYNQWSNYTLNELAKRSNCLNQYGTNWNSINNYCLTNLKFPSVEANMLQIFMSLVIGITSGMWVWCNRKSIQIWLNCLNFKKSNKKTHSTNQNYLFNKNNHKINQMNQLNNLIPDCNTPIKYDVNNTNNNNNYTGMLPLLGSRATSTGRTEIISNPNHLYMGEFHNKPENLLSNSIGLSSSQHSSTNTFPTSFNLGPYNSPIFQSNTNNYLNSCEKQKFKFRQTIMNRPEFNENL